MCVLNSGEGMRFVDELRRIGIDVTVHSAGPDFNPALVIALRAEARDYRPDIVHTHLVHADTHALPVARSLGVATVSSMHATPAFYRRAPLRQVGWATGRLAQRRIAISEHVARFIREIGLAPENQLRVVHYGIDADAVVGVAPRDLRAQLALDDDDIVVGIASRLIPAKGHDLLFTAFASAAQRDSRLKLLVAGDGPERGSLETLAAKSCPPESVHFLGFVDDVGSFMHAFDILAFPTQPEFGEGFGLAVLEAMAARKPVVATAVASLPEVVDDGVTGILVDPSSPVALESALLRIAADPELRDRMGAAGARRARDVFSLESMVDGTLAVYDELL